jgi:acyl-CoA synthetase (AMP-forming)/AMP-acid ligase II
MSGYYKNERETELCTCAGFIKTGDRGYIDKEGNIFISDRIKNIIKRSGINITPAEIDQVFLGHEDVIDCASFGVPDKDYGERLVTALVLQNGLRSQEKYIKYAIDRLPVFLVPNEIIFLDSIPKGPTGKVLVGKLRDDYLNYP